jgi:hypothetical protein
MFENKFRWPALVISRALFGEPKRLVSFHDEWVTDRLR